VVAVSERLSGRGDGDASSTTNGANLGRCVGPRRSAEQRRRLALVTRRLTPAKVWALLEFTERIEA
jgi:hypothetical protein